MDLRTKPSDTPNNNHNNSFFNALAQQSYYQKNSSISLAHLPGTRGPVTARKPNNAFQQLYESIAKPFILGANGSGLKLVDTAQPHLTYRVVADHQKSVQGEKSGTQ